MVCRTFLFNRPLLFNLLIHGLLIRSARRAIPSIFGSYVLSLFLCDTSQVLNFEFLHPLSDFATICTLCTFWNRAETVHSWLTKQKSHEIFRFHSFHGRHSYALEPAGYWFVGTEWHILSISSFDAKTLFWSNCRYFTVVILLHSLHRLHVFAPVIHPCDVQKMCKSVQSQNQPDKMVSKWATFLLDFWGISSTKIPSFIQATILHDTSVLWQGLGHPNRHRLI